MAARAHCRKCQMAGEGIGSILKKMGRFLGPIIKKIGPTVLKEIILPLVKKKIQGGGKPKRKQKGSGLRLAGQRR